MFRAALCLALALASVGCSKPREEAPPATADKAEAKSTETENKKSKPSAEAPDESAKEPVAPTAKGDVKLKPYSNSRFGFTLGVPDFLEQGEEPTNGDGGTFRGKLSGGDVELRAWGMNEVLPIAEHCAKPKGATFHEVKKDTCFSTGIDGGRIFWSRTRLKNGTLFSVHFEYPESLKKEMDPIVTAVYQSWKY